QQRESPIPLDELNPQVPRELGQAVAMALAIDQEARPADAMLLADALRNGAQGISPLPPGAPTVHLGTSAATRVLPNRDAPTAATRVATRREPTRATQVRQAPPPLQVRPREPARAQPTRAGQRAGAQQRRPRRAARRLGALLAIALLFTAAVAAAVV